MQQILAERLAGETARILLDEISDGNSFMSMDEASRGDMDENQSRALELQKHLLCLFHSPKTYDTIVHDRFQESAIRFVLFTLDAVAHSAPLGTSALV